MAKGLFTIDGIDYNEVWNNYLTPAIDRYNEVDETDLEALLAVRDDERIKKYLVRTTDAFSKLADGERPDRSKAKYGKFQGLTQKFGAGYGYTFDFLKDANLQMIIDHQANILELDRENIRNEILKACLLNSTDGFYNGSFETNEGISAPPKYGANTFSASHTHYIGSTKTAVDLELCADIRAHIREHGHKGRLVGFINSADEKALTKIFVPTSSSLTVANPLTDLVAVDGYINRAGGIDWVATEIIPSGYILVVATNPEVDAQKPVALIEPINDSYKGLLLLPGDNKDYPIINSYYLRWIGAKVIHRGAGVAVQLDSASYNDPSL